MKKKLITISIILSILSLALAACSAAVTPPTTEVPTTDPGAMQATSDALNTQVADAVAHALTSTALANPPTATALPPTDTPTTTPSLTPIPATSTPVPTIFVPTATRVVVLPSATPTQGKYQCIVTAQAPAQWGVIPPGNEFDANWTIKNVGTQDWASGEVDYYYIDGQAMQKRGDAFDLNQGVDTGDTVKLVVDMVAPRTNGYYTTTWGVRYNGTLMCTMKIEITVR